MRTATALIAGLFLGCSVALAAPQQRLVVGLKVPATPQIVRQIAKEIPATVLRVGAGGVYLLVRPDPGATPEKIRAAAPHRIAYVEPEVSMGLGFRKTREAP